MTPFCTRFITLSESEPDSPDTIVEPMLSKAPCCAALSSESCLLISSYPPMAETFGRYFVRADFLMLSAMSCCTFPTASCRLFLSAIALQLSNVSVCAWASHTQHSVRSVSVKYLISVICVYCSSFIPPCLGGGDRVCHFSCTDLLPMRLPSQKMLILYVPGTRASAMSQTTVCEDSCPVYSNVLFAVYCMLRFS